MNRSGAHLFVPSNSLRHDAGGSGGGGEQGSTEINDLDQETVTHIRTEADRHMYPDPEIRYMQRGWSSACRQSMVWVSPIVDPFRHQLSPSFPVALERGPLEENI
jgi:hypothetical protein